MSIGAVPSGCGAETDAGGTRARRVLHAARGGSPMGGANIGADEGARRSDAADDGGGPLEGRAAGLHLRFHERSRAHPTDDLAPHGKAEGGGPGRLREARDLGLLLVAKGPTRRDPSTSCPADRLRPFQAGALRSGAPTSCRKLRISRYER